jgi:Immunity protein 8
VRAELKHLAFDPEPGTLPADPASFAFLVRMFVGPADGAGEESFDLTVCSPQWLATQCAQVGPYNARHHVVVNVEDFDRRQLESWLRSQVQQATGSTWSEIADRISRLGAWEFED